MTTTTNGPAPRYVRVETFAKIFDAPPASIRRLAQRGRFRTLPRTPGQPIRIHASEIARVEREGLPRH